MLQQRRQHKKLPASAYVKEFVAGTYYSSVMHTARGHAATGAVSRQNLYVDKHIVPRSSATDTLVFQPVRSFATGRVDRQELYFVAARQASVISADEDEGSRASDYVVSYGKINLHPLRTSKQQQNWKQH